MKAEGALRSLSAKDFCKAHADSQAVFPNNLLQAPPSRQAPAFQNLLCAHVAFQALDPNR